MLSGKRLLVDEHGEALGGGNRRASRPRRDRLHQETKRCKLEGGVSQVYEGKPWGTVGLRWMPFMEVGILGGSGLGTPQ